MGEEDKPKYKPCSKCSRPIENEDSLLSCAKCRSIDAYRRYLEESGCLI